MGAGNLVKKDYGVKFPWIYIKNEDEYLIKSKYQRSKEMI